MGRHAVWWWAIRRRAAGGRGSAPRACRLSSRSAGATCVRGFTAHPNPPVVRPVSRGHARGVASGDVVFGDAPVVVDEALLVMVEGAFAGGYPAKGAQGWFRLSGVRGFCGVKRLAIEVGGALGARCVQRRSNGVEGERGGFGCGGWSGGWAIGEGRVAFVAAMGRRPRTCLLGGVVRSARAQTRKWLPRALSSGLLALRGPSGGTRSRQGRVVLG